jgi:hypothetical protein
MNEVPTLPNGGYYITFNDKTILYLPNSTLYYAPNQRLAWYSYVGNCTNYAGEDIWEVIYNGLNPSFVQEGYPKEYILKSMINLGKYEDKLMNESFWIEDIEFRGEMVARGFKKNKVLEL